MRLVRPVNNQRFRTPARVRLEADLVGGLQPEQIEFLADGAVITNLKVSGSSFVWTNPPAGPQELRARLKSQPAVLSAPVRIFVETNAAPSENKIFAGPFSRTSFVLNDSGEVSVFGMASRYFGFA